MTHIGQEIVGIDRPPMEWGYVLWAVGAVAGSAAILWGTGL